ncbi:MAG: hypothetical protein L0H73_17865 [Nitrococcus sp.]|nr:hypothetical protein [Nitrococcus sp.]
MVTDRDWQSRHEVESTPGGERYSHWIDGAYSRGVDGAGDDVITSTVLEDRLCRYGLMGQRWRLQGAGNLGIVERALARTYWL